MYRKVLVPLDGSIKEVEGVLDIAADLIDEDGEGVLLHVIPPGETRMNGLFITTGAQEEKDKRARASSYLKYFTDGLNRSSARWRGEVLVSKSVSQAVLDFARQEDVDVIAMYTHDRKGLARMFKGSVTEQVTKRGDFEVRVVRPQDLGLA